MFVLKVFDYDFGLQDDFMGATKLNLTQLELNRPEEIMLKLTDPARPLKDLGEIKCVITLMPKTQEDKEQVCVCASFNENTHVRKRKKKACWHVRKVSYFSVDFHTRVKIFPFFLPFNIFKCILYKYGKKLAAKSEH
jgi:hypothetical protein